MTTKDPYIKERGIAHLGLLVVVLLVLAATAAVAYRVSNAGKTDSATTQSATSEEEQEAKDAESLNDAEAALGDTDAAQTTTEEGQDDAQ